MRKTLPAMIAVGSVLCLSQAAMAHPDHVGLSYAAGLSHPLSGVDHLIAALAVGFLAARIGGRSLLMLPALFIGIMSLACLLPQWLPVGMADTGSIALLAILASLAIFKIGAARSAGIYIVALLAMLQGVAHSAVIGNGVGKIEFALGLASATAALSLIAMAVTISVARLHVGAQVGEQSV